MRGSSPGLEPRTLCKNDQSQDADEPLGVQAVTVQGLNNFGSGSGPTNETVIGWYDFGFTVQSTLAVISGVRSRIVGESAVISWDVALEIG